MFHVEHQNLGSIFWDKYSEILGFIGVFHVERVDEVLFFEAYKSR